jgi:predicted RNase H-like HicB family nuclease
MTGRNLLVHSFKDSAGGLTWAYAPELPGLFATGDSEHEATKTLAETFLGLVLCYSKTKKLIPYATAWQPKHGNEHATRIVVPATMQQWEKRPSEFPVLASAPKVTTSPAKPTAAPQPTETIDEVETLDID